jgi:hypothetical protein
MAASSVAGNAGSVAGDMCVSRLQEVEDNTKVVVPGGIASSVAASACSVTGDEGNKKRRLADKKGSQPAVFSLVPPDFEKEGQEAKTVEDILKIQIRQQQIYFSLAMNAFKAIHDRVDKTSSKCSHIEERLMKAEGGYQDMQRMETQVQEFTED